MLFLAEGFVQLPEHTSESPATPGDRETCRRCATRTMSTTTSSSRTSRRRARRCAQRAGRNRRAGTSKLNLRPGLVEVRRHAARGRTQRPGPVAGLTAPGVSSAVVPVRVRFPRRAGEGRLAELLGQRPAGDVLHDTDVHVAVGVDVSQPGRRTACTSVCEAGPLNGRRAAVRSCRSGRPGAYGRRRDSLGRPGFAVAPSGWLGPVGWGISIGVCRRRSRRTAGTPV